VLFNIGDARFCIDEMQADFHRNQLLRKIEINKYVEYFDH
jgi:hypothetical protein